MSRVECYYELDVNQTSRITMGTLRYILQRDMDTLALQGFLCLLNVTPIYKTRMEILLFILQLQWVDENWFEFYWNMVSRPKPTQVNHRPKEQIYQHLTFNMKRPLT